MEAALGDYLGLRRALGHKLDEHERQLTRFVARLDAAGATFVSMAGTLAFVFDPDLDPASSNPAKRLMAVRGFTRYLSAIDPRTEVPPAGLVSCRPSRRAPYLFSDEDVAAVVRAARASASFAFRAETLASLVVLLAVTGMRVGEALRVDCCDVDWDQAVIKVRGAKFGKGRDVVVSGSTVDALASYRSRRDSRRPATARLFVSLAGTPVIYSGFSLAFRQAVLAAGVGAEGPARPRVHDLRHSFAVRTLLGWYRAGLDVEALLPRLSTYLGHREPRFTYRYLTATPELLGHAAARLEATQAVIR
ncbi:tyrosine-type recombinase/integrase [Candidatus Nephthysia bennettiae]|uniref:Tyrosine-type recombinase/integrase n=1 Tax=Candidatus Nephthysia bennettiae TaxID=3127016 RepID=A0A934N1I5_9BACT|nr:tyrosine-type recombinase/integrase [Candidatus Dormibacteraeota bacterium]MBJ7605538.1 tyrosine-type recombinase/integrase [Candidatus Dormibacteraeota bacterium]MBJ7613285.1 tyrosine-type recombinase/integrase [Candidatus Dormibacteraeota bacterium]